MPEKTRYSLGFSFSPLGSKVALIRKLRPAWQAGLLNSIGGHVLEGESFVDAQCREMFEECGVVTTPGEWQQFAWLDNPNWIVCCFRRFSDDIVSGRQVLITKTDEKVGSFEVSDLFNTVPNLKYLIPLALDKSQTAVPTLFYPVDKS